MRLNYDETGLQHSVPAPPWCKDILLSVWLKSCLGVGLCVKSRRTCLYVANPGELMVSIFDGKIVPNNCKLAGYTWLISHFDLTLPVRNFSCISEKRLSLKREQKGEGC